jgi:hypothetical protein
MQSRFASRSHRARGQNVLEFGLLLALVVSLFYGIFVFGFLLNDWISITSGTSVGVRQAAIGACLGPTCTQGETSVLEAVMTSPPLLAVTSADIALVDKQASTASCQRATRNSGSISYTPITAGWQPDSIPCGSGSFAPQINDTISVVIRTYVDVPWVDMPCVLQHGAAACSTSQAGLEIATSSTARYEGSYIS